MRYSKHIVELASVPNAFVAAPRQRRNGVAKSAQQTAVVLLLLIGLLPQCALQAQARGGGGGRQGVDVAPATGPAVSGFSGARAGGGSRGRGGGAAQFGGGLLAPQAQLGDGPTCSLDATIYDVRVAADQIGRIDMNLLARAAAAPDAFEKALTDMGTSRALYRANQSVRLAGDSITISTNVPYITSSQTTGRGAVANTVSYSSTGALFNLTGKPTAAGRVELDLSIQLSSLSEGATEIAPGVKAAVFRNSTMSHKGMIKPQEPFVVVSVDASSADANGKAVAYIARVTLGALQSPTDVGRGN